MYSKFAIYSTYMRLNKGREKKICFLPPISAVTVTFYVKLNLIKY